MNVDTLALGSLAILGIPLDFNSMFLRGPALAPARIRQVLHNGSSKQAITIHISNV
jgi:arginase